MHAGDARKRLPAAERRALIEAAAARLFAEPSSLARLPAILDAWFGYVEDHPYAWRMLFRDTTGDPEIEAFHSELRASARALTIGLIEDEPELALPADQVEPLAELIRSATTGLALWWLDHPETPRALLVATVDRVLREGIGGGPLSGATGGASSKRSPAG